MNKLIILSVGIALFSCKPKYKEQEWSKGEIDPTRLVVVGDAHVSGYMNDGLFYEGQQLSVGNLLNTQLTKVGGGTFHQPLAPVGSDGISMFGLSRFILGYKTDCLGATSLSPVRKASAGDASIFTQNLYNSSALFGNFGIPGMKSTDVSVPFYGDASTPGFNPFFARMKSAANTSVIQDAVASNPTLFTLFLGVEDVLPYAKSGAKTGSMTSVAAFTAAYEQTIQALIANGAKGVVSTIPDPTDMPWFTTIPYNGLNLTEEKAASLNQIYNPLGYYFTVGLNAFMMEDLAAGAFGVRPLQAGELVLLSTPLDSVKCNQMGSVYPFRNEFVLSINELASIRAQINAYNTAIINLANSYGLAIVQTNSWVKNVQTGFSYNGVTMSSKFVSGGVYSLDGIHFSGRGAALFTNEIIKALNAKYTANIPQLDANTYDATLFP